MLKFEFRKSVINLSNAIKLIFRAGGPDRLLFYSMRYFNLKFQDFNPVKTRFRLVATVIYYSKRFFLFVLLRLFRKIYAGKYTDANPYKLLLVNPSDINHTTAEIYSKRRGWVVDGDWDQGHVKFMERPIPKKIQKHFTERILGNDNVDLQNHTRLKQSTTRWQKVYENIRDEGYKSQRQLLVENPDTAWESLNDAIHPLGNEIGIDIGRNGELLWNICGQHRLTIAKVLQINEVPVQVFRRHSEWQNIREDLRQDRAIPDYLYEHPDLQDLK
jgi:hypothetical protein